MFSLPTAPAKQSVSETITVLSGRLSSATLLEDRRAAILGLRSFAKDFPASVASGALRSLIGSLSKDGEDVDTVKVVLETLLMLFSPNEDSPEASEEIALWLADEFTQRQENITLLLDFLDTPDFYSRLYSLQLLGAILSARTDRTEECIFTAPLGISRLVSILDDQREAIRNEAITLLTYLTPTSVEIQKLVAFENAFDRVFAIIQADGSLADGGRTVEDCLIFLANLLRGNISNQSLFRESGCMNRLTELLSQVLQPQADTTEIASWAEVQKNRNVYAFLAVIRLFIVRGSAGTPQNQNAIWKHGLGYQVLQLAFSQGAQVQIKAEALTTCGDIIRRNSSLQEGFAQLMVPSPLGADEQNPETTNGVPQVYVIDGLLDLTLCLQELQEFDVRFAASECLQAYFANHAEVTLHFLSRAIEGHDAGNDEATNVLTILLRSSAELAASDPYRIWFAAVVTFHLIYENPAAKAKAMSLTEGDSADGEEVVTGIQTITAHVISGLRRDDDPRVVIGYLMLLLCWLFEDLDAVNDFLAEGSNIQSIIQAVTQPATVTPGAELVQGLCAMLLGVAYEFSTKDSPVPRATLHSILMSRVDRDQYLDKLGKLRSHPLVRDFEVTPQKLDTSFPGRLPEVYFDKIFVEFLKDNYSRVARALDRDPTMEISVIANGVQKGVSRELVDSLRSQVEEKERVLQESQEALTNLERQLGQEQADHRRTREAAVVDMSRIKNVNDGLQKHHEDELRKFQAQQSSRDQDHRNRLAQLEAQSKSKDDAHRRQLQQLESHQKTKEATHRNQLIQMEAQQKAKENDLQRQFQNQLEQARKAAEGEAEKLQRRTEAEKADFKATISRLEVDLIKANKSKVQELQSVRDEMKTSLEEEKSRTQSAENKLRGVQAELQEAHATTKQLRTKVEETETALAESDRAKEMSQSELEDLLIVFGDLEDKVAKYKARLVELGETVSDGEDSEDDDDDDDEDGTDEEDGDDDDEGDDDDNDDNDDDEDRKVDDIKKDEGDEKADNNAADKKEVKTENKGKDKSKGRK